MNISQGVTLQVDELSRLASCPQADAFKKSAKTAKKKTGKSC